MSAPQRPRVTMEEVSDPEELAKAYLQHERFERNSAWPQSHIPEVYDGRWLLGLPAVSCL